MDIVADTSIEVFLGSSSEQDIKVYTPPAGFSRFVASFMWDVSALTQATNFRLYAKMDGTNWRLFDGTGIVGGLINWTTSSGGRVLRFNVSAVVDFPLKLTGQSVLLLEGAQRSIPVTVGYMAS